MSCKILTDLPSLPVECPYLPAGARSCSTIDPFHWKEALPHLGVFDVILLHYSLPPVEEEANLLLRSGQVALQQAKKNCPDLFHLRYSDQDLHTLCEMGKENRQYLPRFINELRDARQITQEQHQKVIEKYQFKEVHSPSPKPQQDLLFPLIYECLKNHMKPGSQLLCILRPPHSRYEDPQFFEHIITHPSLDYQEKSSEDETLITIKMDSCY